MNGHTNQTPASSSSCSFPQQPRPYRSWLAAAFLLTITFLAYFPAIRTGGFIWDDDFFAQNPVLTQPNGLFKIWTLQLPKSLYYREFPVVYTSFWLERHLWGLQPMGYHLVNVALHAINAILVWLILKRMRFRGAWAAAAIFALHPVHVESVAWISERKNVLSGMFYLLALCGYFRFEEGRGRGWYFGSLGLFLAALLSKPVACTLPLVLLLFSWQRGIKLRFRDLTGLLPFFLLALGSGLFTFWIEVHPLGSDLQFPLVHRILLAARALWFYPMKLLWPVNLTFIYERWNPDTHSISQWFWVLATLGAGVWLWHARHRLGRGFLAAIGFYVITIFPLLGFLSEATFHYSFVADHYQYLASLGLIVIVVGSVANSLSRKNTPLAPGNGSRNFLIGTILCCSILVLLGTLTWRQSRIYKNGDQIWLDTLKKNPSCWVAHNNLGVSLGAQGKVEEAFAHYRKALRLKPDFVEAQMNLGLNLAGQGKVKEAIAQYREVLRLKPDFIEAHYVLGWALGTQDKTEEAIAQFREALRLEPNYPEVHDHLGVALEEQGKADEAIMQYSEALRLKPDFADALNNWGIALDGQGKVEEAIAQYRAALRLNPDFAEAHYNLGIDLAGQGQLKEAVAQYREALSLKPDYAEAGDRIGTVLASLKERTK
jgi:tetratricopeptide (TPR) repeat protein